MRDYWPHYSRHGVSAAAFFQHISSVASADSGAGACDGGGGGGSGGGTGGKGKGCGDGSDSAVDAAGGGTSVASGRPPSWLQGAPAPLISYAGHLFVWKDLEKDLELDPLVPARREDLEEPLEVKPYVWLSQGGVVTPLHYDYYHNFYHQLHGTKTFLLFPPSAHAALHLFPALHPAHRSTQLRPWHNRTVPPSHIWRKRPKFPQDVGEGEGVPVGHEVTLHPGDVLFVPALWFHQVTTPPQPGPGAHAYSLSVNVWSEYRPVALHEEAIAAPLPYDAELAASQGDDFFADEFCRAKVQVVRAYVVLVLTTLGVRGGGGAEAAAGVGAEAAAQLFVRRQLVERRYLHIGRTLLDTTPRNDGAGANIVQGMDTAHVAPGSEDWPRFCMDNAELAEFARKDGGFALHLLQSTVRDVVAQFEEIRSLGGVHRFEMLLLNWVERTVAKAVGARHTLQFLHDLTAC